MNKKTKQPEDAPLIFDIELDDNTLSGMISRRVTEAKGHYNKKYDLDKKRIANKKLYTAEFVEEILRDERYQEIFSENKIFIAIRTILPFVTSNITKPDIIPANDDSLSSQFALDLSKIMVEMADDEFAKAKIKLALQDLFGGQRVGILKQVYDTAKNKWRLVHLDPAKVTIGKRSKLFDEPDMVDEHQDRTIGQLLRQFPDKAEDIKKKHDITGKGTPSQLEVEIDITETWIFIEDKDGAEKLAVVWKDGDLVLGKMSDPNWMDNDKNIVDEHMVPYIFFNILNDGSGYIDETSFIEQVQYSQKQFNQRGTTISENAAYGGTGVPVFGKGAIKAETAAQVQFNPKQRILLDTEDVGKGFTTWTSGNLPNFIMEDKIAQGQAVLDGFGTNSLQSGGESENKTLGQDVLNRNQAEGRQQETVDSIENSMLRFYNIQGQLTYRYIDQEKAYNFKGDDGQFERLVISQSKIAKNLGIKIKIKTGSGIATDRAQEIAQAFKLLEYKRIGTLRLYKVLGLDEPEQAYKEYLREMLMPADEIGEMDKDIYNREADEDLQMVIGGKQPEDREDVTEEYMAHLNDYLLKQQYEMLPEAAQKRVSEFVANVIAQAQRKLLKLETQAQIGQPPAPVGPDGMPIDPSMQDPNAGGILPTPANAPQAAPTQATMPPAAI